MKIKTSGLFNTIRNKSIFEGEKNKNPIIFAACCVVGICIGVACETLSYDVYTAISVNFVDYLNEVSGFSFFGVFLNCAAYNSVFFVISMLLGLCAVGYIFICFVPFAKGLGIGCVCSYIYSAYAIKGVCYCAMLVFPAAIIQMIALIMACSESCQMSKDILHVLEKKESENTEADTSFYILRYCVFFAVMLISCVMYAVMCKVFVNVIN